MDYARAFAISAAGMDVERTRVEVAALNLANASTVQGGPDAAYRPVRAVVQAAGSFSALVAPGGASDLPSVRIEASGAAPRQVHDPGHPLADARGFVTYPGVDPATEMVTLMSALRSYEANVSAFATARTLALKALDIGRSP
jgi:flagellar basal-body rod protein FlgC